jgi:NAD(P)-dependent dehydrogenase (short-subunit alcohol dehydrogenase family)
VSVETSGRLQGKVALVTGGNGNLGSALARAFAEQGADLVLTSENANALERVAEGIRGETGRRVGKVVADLSSAEEAVALADDAWDVFGRIDVVVSNAVPRDGSGTGDISSAADDAWTMVHDVVVWNPMRMLRGLAPRMMEAGGGSIITVVSTAGYVPIRGYAPYGMAKGSLLLLSKYMAWEWGPGGVRVNALNPGSIPIGRTAAEQVAMTSKGGMLDRIAMQRLGELRELVDVAVFLASDESSYVSGQLLSVDGGRF